MRVIQASSKQKRTHPRKVISYLDIQQILKAYEYKAIKWIKARDLCWQMRNWELSLIWLVPERKRISERSNHSFE